MSHLLSMNNFSPSSDQLVNVIDDAASSYSGHSSRSNTPSANSDPSEVNEYPMEYLPCSPFSDSNQGSSNSSSPSNSRTGTSKTILSSSSYSSNFSSSSRHSSSHHLASSSSLPKRMEAALTLCNMNKPLNLASSPRTSEGSDYTSRNQNVFNNMHNRDMTNRMDVPQQNSFAAPGFVLRSDPEELENIDLLQMDSIWRPW